MSQFKDYAKIYDLIYREKDYLSESKYVFSIANKFLESSVKNILELGCGTGNYSRCFTQMGYSVTGVDFSEEMIEIARNNNIAEASFVRADIRNYTLDKKFPLIISLFHVFSYLNTSTDVELFFENAYNHLEKGGLLIFDCWNGEGVLTELPSKRSKTVENEVYLINRQTTPTHLEDKNIVEVNFDFKIEDKINREVYVFTEQHKMRYFFAEDIVKYSESKFELLAKYAWLKEQEVDKTNWYALYVLRKKG